MRVAVPPAQVRGGVGKRFPEAGGGVEGHRAARPARWAALLGVYRKRTNTSLLQTCTVANTVQPFTVKSDVQKVPSGRHVRGLDVNWRRQGLELVNLYPPGACL